MKRWFVVQVTPPGRPRRECWYAKPSDAGNAALMAAVCGCRVRCFERVLPDGRREAMIEEAN